MVPKGALSFGRLSLELLVVPASQIFGCLGNSTGSRLPRSKPGVGQTMLRMDELRFAPRNETMVETSRLLVFAGEWTIQNSRVSEVGALDGCRNHPQWRFLGSNPSICLRIVIMFFTGNLSQLEYVFLVFFPGGLSKWKNQVSSLAPENGESARR